MGAQLITAFALILGNLADNPRILRPDQRPDLADQCRETHIRPRQFDICYVRRRGLGTECLRVEPALCDCGPRDALHFGEMVEEKPPDHRAGNSLLLQLIRNRELADHETPVEYG